MNILTWVHFIAVVAPSYIETFSSLSVDCKTVGIKIKSANLNIVSHLWSHKQGTINSNAIVPVHSGAIKNLRPCCAKIGLSLRSSFWKAHDVSYNFPRATNPFILPRDALLYIPPRSLRFQRWLPLLPSHPSYQLLQISNDEHSDMLFANCIGIQLHARFLFIYLEFHTTIKLWINCTVYDDLANFLVARLSRLIFFSQCIHAYFSSRLSIHLNRHKHPT